MYKKSEGTALSQIPLYLKCFKNKENNEHLDLLIQLQQNSDVTVLITLILIGAIINWSDRINLKVEIEDLSMMKCI